MIMQKTNILHKFMCASLLLSAWTFAGCSDDDTDPSPIIEPPIPPTVVVQAGEITHTSATFKLTAVASADYAYAITAPEEKFADAKELFEKGHVEILDNESQLEITLQDVSSNNDYMLHVATRQVNPYVYSEVVSTPFNTRLDFSETITMTKIGYTDYAYHVEVPAGKTYKHISVRKSDFDFIASMVGGNYETYLSAFGFEIKETSDFAYDKHFVDALDGPVDIYSNAEYLVLAGEIDQDGKIVSGTVTDKLFFTRKANESPYDINVEVSDITSMTAKVTIIPEQGITKYRYVANTEVEFDNASFEGESAIRSFIIGQWDQSENESLEKIQLDLKDLIPQTNYIVGVVGFDNNNGEKVILHRFTTGEPVLPRPVVEASYEKTQEPWNSATFRLKLKNAVSAYMCLHPRSAFDEVLNRPGVSIEDVIINNGTLLTPEQVAEAMTEEGLLVSGPDLTAETEYTFAVYAANEERVGTATTVHFTTEALPQIGGEIRKNMPGKYTATITDKDGKLHTFPVEIATGVNEATTKEYAAKNRLVCLGYGDLKEYPYYSPEAMIEKGWASNLEEALVNYGPKWFIEFKQDGTITTTKPDYNGYDFTMGSFGGKEISMCGYDLSSKIGAYSFFLTEFFIEVSKDYNTITIKPTVDVQDYGTYTYYPSLMLKKGYQGEPLLVGASELVLKRDTQAVKSAASNTIAPAAELSLPRKVTINMKEQTVRLNRDLILEHWSK